MQPDPDDTHDLWLARVASDRLKALHEQMANAPGYHAEIDRQVTRRELQQAVNASRAAFRIV